MIQNIQQLKGTAKGYYSKKKEYTYGLQVASLIRSIWHADYADSHQGFGEVYECINLAGLAFLILRQQVGLFHHFIDLT